MEMSHYYPLLNIVVLALLLFIVLMQFLVLLQGKHDQTSEYRLFLSYCCLRRCVMTA